jgi:Na+/melibiose symporter-like transporter
MTVSATNWRDLVVETIRRPASAARTIVTFNPPPEALWIALALVGVLNTILFTLTNIVVPGPSTLPAALTSPLVILMIVIGGLILSALALYLAGRALGGAGPLRDILLLMIWLQAMRFLAQAVTLVMLFVAPIFAVVFVMAVNLLSIWILLHFINAVHHLESLIRSAGVLIAAIVGLSLALSLLGMSILGSIVNV